MIVIIGSNGQLGLQMQKELSENYVASAGNGPCVGKFILMSYLPPEYAKAGTKLKVEYFGDQFPVTVDVVGTAPLFDPKNDRLKG